jgi:hypothetical protein
MLSGPVLLPALMTRPSRSMRFHSSPREAIKTQRRLHRHDHEWSDERVVASGGVLEPLPSAARSARQARVRLAGPTKHWRASM